MPWHGRNQEEMSIVLPFPRVARHTPFLSQASHFDVELGNPTGDGGGGGGCSKLCVASPVYEADLGKWEEDCMAREMAWLKADVEILVVRSAGVDFDFVGVGD